MSSLRIKRLPNLALRCAGVAIIMSAFCSDTSAADSIEGFTEPYRTVDIAAGDPGVITQIPISEGDIVKEGDLLVKLDSAVLEAALKVAELRAKAVGAQRAAEAELKLRQERVGQLSHLHSRGHATLRELTRAETDFHVAQARLLAIKEDVEAQKLECEKIRAQIDRRNVRSPINGIVAEVKREVGETYLATDPVLVRLVQLDQLKVQLSAPQEAISKLRTGESVELSFPETDRKTSGKIEVISPINDAGSSTTKFIVVIDNRQGELRSGTRCLVEVDSSSHRTIHVSKPRSK